MSIDQDTSLYTSTLSDCDSYNYCLECGNRMDEEADFCSDECWDNNELNQEEE